MSKQNISTKCTAITMWLAIVTPAHASPVSDLNSWALVQDPPHAGMIASVNNPTQVTLTATGGVPAGIDIGYQSVNGNNVASSSLGSYFSASQDFHIAVDFSLTAPDSIGFAAIGFGIGEDSAGTNSAGVLLAILNGVPSAFSGGARINDISHTQLMLAPGPSASGRFFLRYDSLSGNIIYGVNVNPGSTAPSHTGTFSGIQNSWNDKDLLASFFLRSDNPAGLPSLTSGTVSAVFSNFAVLEGTPVSSLPLPATAWLLGSGLLGLIGIAGQLKELRNP